MSLHKKNGEFYKIQLTTFTIPDKAIHASNIFYNELIMCYRIPS